jgi:MoaA/NifB/PqqE/SkfB family radical SAM enzyme
MTSKYWDDFERREKETIDCIQQGVTIPVRRVAIYITKRCNFRCTYCHVDQNPISITKTQFDNVVKTFGKDSILHITGGEPSCVPWLYDYIDSHWGYKFNLNTNAFITPPKNITRMKISFDTCDEDLFNKLVGVDAFETVTYNIQEACKNSTVSLTCVLSKQTYNKTIELARYCNKHFKGLYALFFSLYKGTDPNLLMNEEDIDTFYDRIKPFLQTELNTESLELLNETLDRKIRLQQGVRFPENDLSQPCYISMSERVVAPDGNMYLCSHLYRDGIMEYNPIKHARCGYGCNTRLVKFNNDVHRGITNVR